MVRVQRRSFTVRARTHTLTRAESRSRVAGIVNGVLCLLFGFAMPLLRYLPQAVFAAIIILSCVPLLKVRGVKMRARARVCVCVCVCVCVRACVCAQSRQHVHVLV
jgi:MFS superfamily sulfate permease-like transporter